MDSFAYGQDAYWTSCLLDTMPMDIMPMDTMPMAMPMTMPKLLHKGYAYVVNRTGANHIYWRCKKRKLCNASLKMKDDIIEGDATEHSHPPDPARCTALRSIDVITKRVESSDECTSAIIQNALTDFPLSAAGALPQKETLARMV